VFLINWNIPEALTNFLQAGKVNITIGAILAAWLLEIVRGENIR